MFDNKFSTKSDDSDQAVLKEWAPGADNRAT